MAIQTESYQNVPAFPLTVTPPPRATLLHMAYSQSGGGLVLFEMPNNAGEIEIPLAEKGYRQITVTGEGSGANPFRFRGSGTNQLFLVWEVGMLS